MVYKAHLIVPLSKYQPKLVAVKTLKGDSQSMLLVLVHFPIMYCAKKGQVE